MERRTQAQRRAATEEALLAAAAEIVDECGVEAVTLARVSDRAGYSRGIVTHQFGSKEAMLQALAHRAQAGLAATVDDTEPGLAHLLRLIEKYLMSLRGERRGWSTFLLLWVHSAANPALAGILRDHDHYFRRRVHDDVAAGRAAGEITADNAPADVAVALVGQLRGIGLQRLLEPEAVDLDRLTPSVLAHWYRTLTGAERRQTPAPPVERRTS